MCVIICIFLSPTFVELLATDERVESAGVTAERITRSYYFLGPILVSEHPRNEYSGDYGRFTMQD